MAKEDRIFDVDQMQEIEMGRAAGLDVSFYAKKEFLAIQMREIRLGLMAHVDVSAYADPKYDWFQMEEIRLGTEAGLDYTIYSDENIPYDKMRVIREGLLSGINISRYKSLDAGVLRELVRAVKSKVSITEYVKAGYVEEQLTEICTALEHKINIKPYLSVELRGVAIREIRLGLEEGIDPSVYASIDYNWKQMREIRLGLEHRCDVTKYLNNLYSWKQMREIRLGLEDGLQVSAYTSFVYVASDMEKIRLALLRGDVKHDLTAESEENEETSENTENHANEVIGGKSPDSRIHVFVSNDEMEACIEIKCDRDAVFTYDEIVRALNAYGIRHGILKENIKDVINKKKYNRTILVAKGKPATRGENGRYEFFFDTEHDYKPVILPDGTCDYSAVKMFETVGNGQKIAVYHAATFGSAGYTVTGTLVPSNKGKEKSVLMGRGFSLLPDGKTYVSCMAGKIELLSENHIEITRMCMLDEVSAATGRVEFEGSVVVNGNVGKGSVIHATEDIIVNGITEAAEIVAGGNVILKGGALGKDGGIIKAGKSVNGNFFEYMRVIAGENIEANYSLNSDLKADEFVTMRGKTGMIAGGTVISKKGVVVYDLGNRAKIPTFLKLGVSDDMMKARHNIELKIREAEKQLTILRNAYNDFQKKYAPEVRNTMEMYLKLENAIYTKEQETESLQTELDKYDAEIANAMGARAVVAGVLNEGVIISIDNVKTSVHDIKDVTLRRVQNKIEALAN